MNSKFFTLIKPFLDYIDEGLIYRKPFKWLYIFMAILNLSIPFLVIYLANENYIVDELPRNIVDFLLLWLVISFASLISFQLWWDRSSKVYGTTKENDEFVATPIFAHLIQTYGEWFGIYTTIVGFCFALLDKLVLTNKIDYYYDRLQINFNFFDIPSDYLFLYPFIGFIILISSRFLAEQFKAVASIANNTKK